MWDLPRSGNDPVSSTLAGRFFTTEPPGKPVRWCFRRCSKGTVYQVKSVSNLKTSWYLFCVFSSQGSQSTFQLSLDIFFFFFSHANHSSCWIKHILSHSGIICAYSRRTEAPKHGDCGTWVAAPVSFYLWKGEVGVLQSHSLPTSTRSY